MQQKIKTSILLWDWWTHRNKINSGECRKTPDELCFLINKHLQDFMPEPKTNTTAPVFVHKWELPPPGHVKVNFDASFIAENQDGAFGFITRDDAS
jgi:hypothetical protein